MACPDCKASESTRRVGATSIGYGRFVCKACGRRFNERSGTLLIPSEKLTTLGQIPS